MYIQLNNLVSIMEGFSKQRVYYDTSKEEFFQSNNPEYQDDIRYIIVSKYDDSKIMTMYIEQLNDRCLRDKILSLSSNVDFNQKFHHIINDQGLYNDFIQFSQKIKFRIAEEWCNNNNLKYSLKRFENS